MPVHTLQHHTTANMDIQHFFSNLTTGKTVTLVILLYVLYKLFAERKTYLLDRELGDWFKENNIHSTDPFVEAGVTDLTTLSQLSVHRHKAFQKLPASTRDDIDSKLSKLRQKKIMEYWLNSHKFSLYYEKVIHDGVASLRDLSMLSDKYIAALTNKDKYLVDYFHMKQSISELKNQISQPYDDSSLSLLQSHLWLIKRAKITSYVMWLIVPLCTALVAYSLFTINGRQKIKNLPNYPVFKYMREQFTFNRYCEVTNDWVEPAVVGEMVAFNVQVFRYNGRPFPVTADSDVTITIERERETIPIHIDYNHGDSPETMRVSFGAYQAGLYIISIWLGPKQASCSPISQIFHAGTIEPTKTSFTQFCSTVICTTDTPQPLTIEPRDAYSNMANYNPSDKRQFKIRVCQAGSEVRHFPNAQIISDPEHSTLTMYITMEREGCYQATVTYGEEKLRNGEFDIVVLNKQDHTTMTKSLENSKDRRMWYEARLMSTATEMYDKPKKVYIYISPKQLTVKEFYLRIIGRRLFTFRVCPSTKFTFHGDVNNSGYPAFTIDDGCQPKITLATKEHILVAATFGSYLLRNIGGSETFKDKQAFFYHEVRQFHVSRKHSALPIKVNREDLLQSSYKETRGLSLSGWCSNFTIKFNKEEGLDYGGLRREWFEQLCHCLFDHSPTGLFCRFSENSQGLVAIIFDSESCMGGFWMEHVHPNPKRAGDLKLKHYEFAGRVVGKCLYESSLGGGYRQNVVARFTRSFLAQIIGLRVNFKHFESDDPQLYTSKVKYMRENSVDDLDLYFTDEQYDSAGHLIKTVDLVSNGSRLPVTDTNKHQYVDCLTQHLLVSSIREEMEAFLKGLNELIPDNLLSIFDENELELLLCGTNDYSVDDFKQNHIQAGSSTSFNKVVGWFWTIVAGFSSEQMARLLQFTTGSSALPPGGFAELSPNFQLSSSFTYATLPTAHTCFNQLCLPDYDNIEALHKALCLAINEGNQGFGYL